MLFFFAVKCETKGIYNGMALNQKESGCPPGGTARLLQCKFTVNRWCLSDPLQDYHTLQFHNWGHTRWMCRSKKYFLFMENLNIPNNVESDIILLEFPPPKLWRNGTTTGCKTTIMYSWTASDSSIHSRKDSEWNLMAPSTMTEQVWYTLRCCSQQSSWTYMRPPWCNKLVWFSGKHDPLPLNICVCSPIPVCDLGLMEIKAMGSRVVILLSVTALHHCGNMADVAGQYITVTKRSAGVNPPLLSCDFEVMIPAVCVHNPSAIHYATYTSLYQWLALLCMIIWQQENPLSCISTTQSQHGVHISTNNSVQVHELFVLQRCQW